jgi:hypothetical protein
MRPLGERLFSFHSFRAGAFTATMAGQRGFRSLDVRQTLIYCALNFAAKNMTSPLCAW